MRALRILLIVALVALTGGRAAAESVTLRAAAHDTYGRIVFGWQTPVKYTATIADRRLTIRFDRAIEADFRSVTRSLGKYVTGATAGGDGQSVVFTLADDFTLSHFPQGASVVVDLAQTKPQEVAKADAAKTEAPAAQPAPKPAAKAEESAPAPPKPAVQPAPGAARASGPAVPVRVGEHADKTRLVFDWASEVPYRFAKSGSTATLAFGQPAVVDLKAIQGRPPKFVGGARAEQQGDGVAVTFSVPASSEVRHFRSGAKVVVDILPPSGNDTAPPLAAAQVAAAAPPPPAAAQSAAPPAPRGAASAAAQPGPTALQPQPAAAAPAAAPPAAPGRPPGRPGAVPAPPAPSVTGSGDAISIRLDWEDSVAAALFRRGGSLFAVFDKPVEINVARVKQAGGAALREVEQLPSTQGTILRMTTVSGVNPDLKRDGLAWILEFRQQALGTLAPIDVRVQPQSPSGPRILMQVPQPGNPVTVTDPEFGDNMIVVPIVTLGYGVAQFHRYPQLQILPSGQGVVVMPRIDTLRVRTSRQGIEISSSDGLQVSGVSPEQQAREQSAMRSFSKALELDKWKNDTLATFNDKRIALQQAVAAAKDQAREAARLDLARFYIANGFGAEALGVLEVLRSADEGIAKNAEYHVLRGVGEFLMGHFADTKAALDHEAARNLDEAAFWRAAAEAAEGQLLNASAELRRTGGLTRAYPRVLKILGGTLVAEASAALGDVRQGNLFIEAVGRDKPAPAEQAKLDYVDGVLKEQAGDFDGAVAKWEAVIKSPHRPSRAKATVARAELLLKLNKITFRQAIEDLEKLRFAWRGDEFEFNLLRRLGALYVNDGDYRSGLDTLKQAATHFREHPQAPDVTQQMTEVFSKLYLEDAADTLPPVVAIALYEEFKELTPAGTKGDDMIRKLSDRLVKLEVFDRASELLDAQIAFRLKGPDKARVGAQLALIHLMTKNGEKAIEALKKSDEPGLPADLVQQRRHLYARSQMEMGQATAALELLKDDKSADAELLRAEIFWEAKDWPNAAQSLRKVVQTYETGANAKLQPRQARHVLDLAIAFTLGGNERALDRLRRDYGDGMDKTEYKDAFRLVASTSPETVNDVRAIAGKVKEAESLRTFLSAYRDKLKKQSLSAIN